MKATIVTIGDEILIGQIVDTNSAFIAKLDRIGEINEMISISDDKHIVDTDTLKTSKNTWIWLLSLAVWVQLKMMLQKKDVCDYFEMS
jgi:nicotinamide-nucleotide amidase